MRLVFLADTHTHAKQNPQHVPHLTVAGRILVIVVVLSSYHEFQTSDGVDGQGRIALKVKDHEWARLEAERKKKSRRRNIVATTAYVSMIGVAVVYAPLLLLVFGGGFVS